MGLTLSQSFAFEWWRALKVRRLALVFVPKLEAQSLELKDLEPLTIGEEVGSLFEK